MRLKDIEAANAKTVAGIARGEGDGSAYHGYVDVGFLAAPPFVMLHAGDCGVAVEVLTTGTFEPASLATWCHLARTATGVLDIGAYTGIYAMAAAGVRPDLLVHAFEPNPFSYARLRTNKFTNGFTNIQEHWYGVGAQHQTARLSWNKKHLPYLNSAATFAEVPASEAKRFESTNVEIRRIDEPDFCAGLGDRALIKIDVEGAEAIVMHGLARLLPQKPDFILETFSASACEAINALLVPLGYSAYFIEESPARLHRRARLTPCEQAGAGKNHLLTTRDILPPLEIV